MSSGYFAPHWTAVLILLAFAAPRLHATPVSAKSIAATPFVIETPGKGTFTLSGPWQFHPGDDPAWASPTFDSSDWEQLSADMPWGKQGHSQLTGMAWYRCSITLSRPFDTSPNLSLLMPNIHDSYEIYWNGSLIGQNGKLPPSPVWYISQPSQTFKLGQVRQGVLTVRVWKSPLLSDDTGERGGFDAAPLIGDPQAIANAKAAHEFKWLRSRQLHFGANLLCAAVASLSFLLWLGTPSRWVLFWTAGFAIAQPAILLLLNAHLSLPYPLAMGVAQPLYAIQDISLWFLLLWLLCLHETRTICRITQIFAWIYAVSEVLDGVLVALSCNPRLTALAQESDAVLTLFSLLFEAFPLGLVSYALFRRKQFDSARWLVASLAFLDEMMLLFIDTIKQGRRFTGWSIAEKIDSPLFFLDGNGISVITIAGTLLLIAIIYAAYNSVLEDQRRQETLEREKIELLDESNRMRHHAEHDGLTGLLNRRMIVERLSEEMVRSRRDGTPLCVILADVDYFKKVNDSFGHLAGDLVLKEVGRIFACSLRPYDCVGRYGGEEFLLVLPNCEIESALIRAEQLRAAVQKNSIRNGETLLQVTSSFGVTLVLPSHDENSSVIHAADAALYQAKSSGRNCVIRAEMDSSVCNS